MNEEMSLEEIRKHIFTLLNESPFYSYIGMVVVEAGDGRARLQLPVKEELKNLYGILHGGVIAALLDSSCSIAVGTLLGPDEAAVTLDQRINYISNVRDGVLYGEGKALHKGRFTGVGQAEVRDEEGNLVAAGMTTSYIIRRGVNQVRDAKDPVDERLK
ncbi:MAG: PaaI family thioesterase [Actinobacteria bacterium]|nr:PaaI family thioesterase [Actinomycetota bacterium]